MSTNMTVLLVRESSEAIASHKDRGLAFGLKVKLTASGMSTSWWFAGWLLFGVGDVRGIAGSPGSGGLGRGAGERGGRWAPPRVHSPGMHRLLLLLRACNFSPR